MTALEREIAIQERKFATTIEQIRNRNFMRDLPFLILSDKLPEGQGFYEYADGHIEIQEVYTIGADIETRFIRTLSEIEAKEVREDFKLKNGLF
ncbi:hypothetical protein [Chitinophaga sp. 212800010-3]|uniref:hypothetical protein n=1 Tax=unclassified Chitinophaga TaxID=2619133 RepID=UPI002DE589DC|nr:CYTH domain-containing protein [Chitinophaga sp. 212800010-3]